MNKTMYIYREDSLCIKENNVKVVTVDSVTGEIVNRLSASDHSPNSDSVDGSVPSELINPDIKAFDSLQAALDNFPNSAVNSDGTIDVPSRLSSSSNAISSIGDGIVVTATRAQVTASYIHEASESRSSVNVPQIFRLDGNSVQEVSRFLGKRPGGTTSQNSIVNKVIITKHPSTSQPQAVPIQIQTLSHPSQSSGVGVTTTSRTPTKTITISQQGIVSPMKGITMTQVVGSPPKLPISKFPISPAKTPTKITMIPVSVPGRSPQRIAPAGGQTLLNNTSNVQTTITMSPSKVMKQPGTVHLIQKPIQPAMSNATVVTLPARPGTTTSQGVRQVAIQPGSNLQQIHVPGNKFHYIRLANPSNSTQGTRTVLQSGSSQGLPAAIVAGQTGTQMKITIPAQSAGQTVNPRVSGSASTIQRIILPATQNQVPIRPSPSAGVPGTQIIRTTLPGGTGNLAQIAAAPGGSSFISTGGNTPGVQGFALVPASYLSQIQQQIQVKPPAAVTTTSQVMSTGAPSQSQTRSDYVPIASSNPALSASTQNKNSNVNGQSMDASGGARPRKPCNCTKSQCLKLYCDCFANGEFCHNCNCMNCSNNLEHEEERSRAIKSCLERNPLAFHPKIGKGRSGEKNRQHNKGCNCKRSGCLKNYCECYEAKIMCSTSCKCVGCKNFEESPERKTLMHLADAAEVREKQQTAAKTKLSSQISDLPARPTSSNTGERLPFSFVTSEVVEATCACLLAQAEEAERQKMPPVVQERMVIEEFGRCLLQIIESANRTKAPDPDDTS